MTRVPVRCGHFELFPADGRAAQLLGDLLPQLDGLTFHVHVPDPHVNQGQAQSDFDERLQAALQQFGANETRINFPAGVGQQLDFAFTYRNQTVAVEVEKTNREKILRDVLKAHMYLEFGADISLIVLPRNYAHSKGIWNLFDFGVRRLQDCRAYHFGKPERLDRIAMMGYSQYDAATGQPIDMAWREALRRRAIGTD